MSVDLTGKTAFVTGSSRGIGAATAAELAESDADVAVNYLSSPDAAEETASEVEAAGGKSLIVQADVTGHDDVESMVTVIEATLGTVDVLVNNANMPFVRKPIADLTYEEFVSKVDAELKAAFTVSKAVLPGMVEQEHGRLIYVSSGLSKSPQPGSAAHGTAKSGLNAFARYVAAEYGEYGITANTVSPGLVETGATADRIDDNVREYVSRATTLDPIAQLEDVATAITAFAGDAAQFVTGTYTPVNGGRTME